MQPDVSIIIVNYNAGRMLQDCVESIAAHVGLPYEVIICDNGSTDESIHFARAATAPVRLVEMGGNTGFAAANNAGAEIATGKLLWFLNPDTRLVAAMGADLRHAASIPDAVFVTPMLDANGRPFKSYYVIPTARNYLREIFRRSGARQYQGASVIVSLEAFAQLGGWPMDYFMYGEDLDLFYRAHLAGMPVIETKTPIIHHWRGSSSKVWSLFETEVRNEVAKRIFFRKYNLRADLYFTKLVYLIRLLRKPRDFWFQVRVLRECAVRFKTSRVAHG